MIIYSLYLLFSFTISGKMYVVMSNANILVAYTIYEKFIFGFNLSEKSCNYYHGMEFNTGSIASSFKTHNISLTMDVYAYTP